jgi:hypothetical protein
MRPANTLNRRTKPMVGNGQRHVDTTSSPLEFARATMAKLRPTKAGDEQTMAYDYVPGEILPVLPRLYEQEDRGEEAVVWIKLFHPASQWTWYLTEYDPETGQAFGMVVGHEAELGYFSIEEMEVWRDEFLAKPADLRRLPPERDLWWTPKTLSDVREHALR